MNNIIELEYYEKAIVAHYLNGEFNIYPYNEETKQELLKKLYIPGELTEVKRIRSKENRKEINSMINFYFNNDTLDIEHKTKKINKF